MMTFAFTAMDQIVNQMAKIHYMFGGQATFPIVFVPRLAVAVCSSPTFASPIPCS